MTTLCGDALLQGDTSHQAKLSIAPHKSRLQALVLDVFRMYRIHGLTSDECGACTGLKHQTVSARIRELVLSDDLYDCGDRRKTSSGRSARVYKARS